MVRKGTVAKGALLLGIIATAVLLRLFLFTTYYLETTTEAAPEGLSARSLLLIHRTTSAVERGDLMVFDCPLTSISVGRCLAIPGTTAQLSDTLSLPAPSCGQLLRIDSARLHSLAPLLHVEMSTDNGKPSPSDTEHLKQWKHHRFSQDYYLVHTLDGSFVWVTRTHIVGKVIGSLKSPF